VNDQLEFNNLYNDFRPRILRYMKRMVGEGEAEDLTQAVFVKVNNSLSAFRAESQVSTWIYKIATNTALDRLRSLASQRIVTKGSLEDPFAHVEVEIETRDAWTGEKAPTPDATLVRKEMNDCIRGFIEKLPADYRTVVLLSEVEQLKNAEIANILGISIDTVKIRLHRARARLRRELETNCSFYRDERNELACDLKEAFAGFREIR